MNDNTIETIMRSYAHSAVSDKKDADIFCSGAVVDYGAEMDAGIDAVGGIHNRSES